MSLFEVPGWSVKTTPIRGTPQQVSKKRKRPNNHANDVETTEINMEKLMAKLANTTDEGLSIAKKRKKAQKQAPEATSNAEQHTEGTHVRIPGVPTKTSSPSGKRNGKKKHYIDPSLTLPSTSTQSLEKPPSSSNANNLTALQKGMKDSLDGARFRYSGYFLCARETRLIQMREGS